METRHSSNKQWIYYGIGFFAIVVYSLFTFLAPQNPSANTFELTQAQLFFLKFTIALPYFVTWILGLYGLFTLERYIELTEEDEDAVPLLLSSFYTGLVLIFSGTMLAALVGSLKSYFVTNAFLLPFFTIATNYLYVFPSLVGFFVIYRGVSHLQSSREMAEYRRDNSLFSMFIVLLLSAFYVFLIFTNSTRQFSVDSSILVTYFLPDIFILATLVLPIIFTWWLGFFSAFTMSDIVPSFTRMELYKGMTRILYGIWSIIFASIVIQALLSLGNTRLYSVGLVPLLFVIYIFVLLQGFGYFFIAFGAHTLQKSVKEHDVV